MELARCHVELASVYLELKGVGIESILAIAPLFSTCG